MTLHRAEFHGVLLRQLSNRIKTYNSKRLASYSQPKHASEPIQLTFTDGTTARCDVLVGADGLKSAVRASMMHERATRAEMQQQLNEAAALRDCIRPRFGGSIVYRCLVPGEKLAQLAPQHRALSAPYQVSIIFSLF
jgi:salicylate hydroxylase